MQLHLMYSRQRQLLPISVFPWLLAFSLTTADINGGTKDQGPDQTTTAERSMQKLRPMNSVIGNWRGVGQPKRGSRQGAWQETSTVRWDFTGRHATVLFQTKTGAQFRQLQFTLSDDLSQLRLIQLLPDDTSRTYSGPPPGDWPAKILLVSDVDEKGMEYRCTIQQLSDIRLVLLFEKRTAPNGRYRRIAGIGYTRSGRKLTKGADDRQLCVVTGGRGTIAVQHQGQTWYVCCEGCRQVFEESPDEIIAKHLASDDDESPRGN